MRVTFIPPSEHDFKRIFLSIPLRKGGAIEDINVFQSSLGRRKGSGILSFISGIAKKVLPFLVNAAKPSVKEFGTSVVKDMIEGNTPLRKSLKSNGMKALQQTGLRLIRGRGRVNVKNTNIKKRIKKNTNKKNNKNPSRKYKRDIFELL